MQTSSGQDLVNSLMSDLRKQDQQEARDERRHLDVDVNFGKSPKNHRTLADSLVQFSHRLAESDSRAADIQGDAPAPARAPIPLGSDGENRAALRIARETSPDDQVPRRMNSSFVHLLSNNALTSGGSCSRSGVW
jgi:hypothetical protein